MRKKKDSNSFNASSDPQDLSLTLYLRDIAKTKPLSSKEEAELTVRIRKNDQDALHTLVKANLRFVVSVSRTYQNQGLPLIDLINEGNLGLIEAAKRFDESKNFRFISYAVWWIRQAILQLLAERSRIVRLPLNRVGSLHKIGVAQQKLEQRLKRLPSTGEIARELNTLEPDVQKLIIVGTRHVSLDASLDGESGDLHGIIPSNQEDMDADGGLFDFALSKEMGKTLNTLDKREQEIIKLYFGIGQSTSYTLAEIGVKFRITRERVRQIRQTALAKLQRSSNTGNLRAFLQR